MEQNEKYERRLGLKAPTTQRIYRAVLNRFLRAQGLTEAQLHDLAESDLDEVALRVQEAMKAEKDRGMKPSTAYMIYKSVKFFLRSYGIKGFELQREDRPRMVYNGSRRMTKEHIRELWDSFAQSFKGRNRAILFTLKDSGLRISDLARLDVEHYRGAREVTMKGEKFKVFEPFKTQKTGDIAHIHLGPESVEAIDEYLGTRMDGPLFVSAKGGRLTTKALSEIFHQTKLRRKLKGDFNKISAHSLRKYHWSSLPINEGWICWLEGKATSVYLDEPAVTDAYIKNYDTLRIFGAPDTELEEERQKQSDRVAELEAQLRANQEDLKATQGQVTEMLKMVTVFLKDKEKEAR